MGDRPACSLLTGELQKWLDLRGAGPVNRGNLRRVFVALFNYAVDNSIMPTNPATRLAVPQADEKMPEFLPVATVEALMEEARAKYPALVPFLALGAFAGLRPDEARGLKWESINLKERLIRVLPGTSKTRRARLVTISDNLARWLADYRMESGAIGLPKITETRWRRKIMESIGMDRWPPDVLRHSFATYQLAKVPDVAALAEMMGNSPSVIYRHYKGLATAKEAAKYFKIMPPKPKREGKVIPFKAKSVAA
jgi:integrase